MSCEDCEGFEPDELSLKINDLIKAEVEARIKQTCEDLEQSVLRNKALIFQLNQERSKVAQFDSDIKKALAENRKEIMREIFNGFAVGDRVYYRKGKNEATPCETCGRTGKVNVLVNGQERTVECPDCRGCKEIRKHYYVPQEDIISTVHIEINDRHKWFKCWLKDKDYEEKEIFKTLEECQEACKPKA